MTTIYLIRHAEAEGNLYRRVQGQFDGAITPRGQKQIDALSERFCAVRLDAVYSSDLVRAYDTALGVAKDLGLPVKTMPALREINLGVWDNRAWADLENDEAEEMSNFSHNPERWSVAGGEPFADLTGRIAGAILELAERHDGETIAVVSHGMAIRALLCHVLNVRAGDQQAVPHGDNTSVSLLHVEDGSIRAEYCNDTSHLPQEISTFAKQTWWRENADRSERNIRCLPFDPLKESELYTRCYRETWIASHGRDEGFNPKVYLQIAKRHAKEDPRSIVKAMRGDVFSGLLEMDVERAKESGAGWISLLYLVPSERGKGLAVQLIGHAAALFKELGRGCLRLHVAEENEKAIGFYRHMGFRMIGTAEGAISRLYLMEKTI